MLNSFPRRRRWRRRRCQLSYTSPSATCQGGEIPLWRKQLLLIPLYRGPNTSQKWWGLVNKPAVNHANGRAVAGSLQAGEGVIECGDSREFFSPSSPSIFTAVLVQSHQHGWM